MDNYSYKQKQVIAFAGDPTKSRMYAGGVVRSGKSASSLVSFSIYVMQCEHPAHCLTAPSVESAMRNAGDDIIAHIKKFGGTAELYRGMGTKIRGKTFDGRDYHIDVIGATDERSKKRIQGATYAGMLIDEVVSIPESFFEMALTRLSLDVSKLWCTYNPDRPTHWFKKKFEDKGHKQSFTQILHFQFKDNPSITSKVREQLESSFSGHFYKRYIEGKWAGASGLVYDQYNTYTGDKEGGRVYLAVDYGIRIFAGLRIRKIGEISYIEDEIYHDNADNKTLTELEQVNMINKLCPPSKCFRLILDPATNLTFKESLRRKNYSVYNGNNKVVAGIRTTQNALMRGQLLINTRCENLIGELDSYSWDSRTSEDKPVKEYDHATDAMRYYAYHAFSHIPLKQIKVKDALYGNARRR